MPERTFTAIFEQDEDGWWVAQCEEVPGAITQGQTLEEARENLKEAIQLALEVQREMTHEERTQMGRMIIREMVQVAML